MGAFATFGGPFVLDLVAKVTDAALKAAWCQKWAVHRRLRPEAFGGRVHNHLMQRATYPIHQDLLGSPVLPLTNDRYRSYLLPMAYPEGSPLHTSYPAGHATLAGAGATVLKALFDESWVIPNPVEAAPDGLSLVPYTGSALTLGGELNKLAANITLPRDTAGVHWRSDGVQGMLLGEAVAIGWMRDQNNCFAEQFAGFTLTRFDGTRETI